MPKRLLIIGLLFVLGGVLAVWSIVEAAMHSHINVNLAVFLLPVGIGLLRGRASSQKWARFWIILGYVILAALTILALTNPGNVRANWFDHEIRGRRAVPYLIGACVTGALLLAAMHRLLYSQRACAWFFRR